MDQKHKIIWITDPHLDMLMPWTFVKFLFHLREEQADAIFLTGDISNGIMISLHLELLAVFAQCPIYFVMGNHDYFFSSFEKVNNKLRELCKKYPNLIWIQE